MEPIVTEEAERQFHCYRCRRKAAFGNLQGHAIHDSAINYLVLLDQLEWQRSDNTSNFGWVLTAGLERHRSGFG